MAGTGGGIKVNQAAELTARVQEVLCFPLHAVLVAMGVRTVHYFSLDVENAEMNVLRSIPFDKVDIKVRVHVYLLMIGVDPGNVVEDSKVGH